MRSRRRQLEWSCRIAAFALLGWLFGESAVPTAPRRVESARGGELAARLPVWTRAPSSVALHAILDAAPSATTDDWLAALGHAGHSVTWSGGAKPLAMSVEPATDPRGGVRLSVAAPAGAMIVFSDAAGPLDSLHLAHLGGTLVTPAATGAITAVLRGGADSLRIAPPEPVALHPVLIVGQAGWEGKFAAAALAERGWNVVTEFSVAPKIAITSGAPAGAALDTARLSAVVVLDSLAASRLGGVLARYARSGGGVVLAGNAARAAGVASIAPGALLARSRPSALPADTIGLGTTGFYAVSLGADAVALERRRDAVSIAARRVGAGRVLEVGYDDSWRWRMAGGAAGEEAHRRWWTHVVGAAAYLPVGRAEGVAVGEAPFAALVARVGPAQAAPASRSSWAVDPRALLMLILVLLSTEWTSRRLRGLK
jgi:hypothetical protein